MSGSQQHGGSSGHLRFYIVMTTLIVGVVLFLLFMNDSSGFGITSAIVGVDSNATTEEGLSDEEDTTAINEKDVEEAFGKTVKNNDREVEVNLWFDQIPSVTREAKVKDIELRFQNTNTKINVNNDRLELNNLQDVHLRLTGFSGKMDFDRQTFSLSGTARSIMVNDIALSSKGELKISFNDLAYDYLGLDEIQLGELTLPAGDGHLSVGEKMTYELEQDQLKLYFFNGKLVVDRAADSLVLLEGVVKGITGTGPILSIRVQ